MPRLESLEGRQLLSLGTEFLGVTPVQGDTTQHLVSFNSSAPGSEIDLGSITGVSAGFTLDAISTDPSNGNLYGVAFSGGDFQFYQINPQTLVATAPGGVHNFEGVGVPPVGFYFSNSHYNFYEAEEMFELPPANNVYYGFDSDGNSYSGNNLDGPLPVGASVDTVNSSLVGVDANYHLIESTTAAPQAWTDVAALSPNFATDIGLQTAVNTSGNAFLTGSILVGAVAEYHLYSLNEATGATGDLGTLPEPLLGFAPTVQLPYFAVTGVPGTVTAGASKSVTVTAYNGDGTVDTGYAGTVHFTSSDGQAVLPGDTTLVAGTGSFPVTFETAGLQSITASDVPDGMTGVESNILVTAAAATHFAVAGAPGGVAGTSEPFSVTALDTYGNVDTAFTGTVHFTSSDGQAVLPANATLTSGTGNFSATLKTAGSRSITATDLGNPAVTGTQSNILVTAAAATHFAVAGAPGGVAGTSEPFSVTARDAYGNTNTAYTGTVHFTSSDGQAVLPSDTVLTLGVGNYAATLKTAGAQSITATDIVLPGITGTQANIVIVAAAATHFSVSGAPGGNAGTSEPFTVTALDTYGNTDAAFAGTVHFTSSDGQAVLPADTMLTSGTGNFSATLKTAGSRSITGTELGAPLVTGTQTGIAIHAAAASHFAVAGDTGGVAGTSEPFSVTALDPYGNVDTDYLGTVHFTSSDGQAVLPADSTLAAGTGSFGATLKTAGSQSITATDTATPGIVGTQSNIPVTPAAATHLVIAGPTSGSPGVPQVFTVTALDPFGNVDTNDTSTIQVTSSDPAASLPPNFALVNGVGQFSVTFATSGAQSITTTDTGNPDLTTTSPGIAVGTVFNGSVYLDLNANGIQDPGEPGMAGRFVYLDLKDDGRFDPGDPSAVTDSNGLFTLVNTTASSHAILEDTSQDSSYRFVVDQTRYSNQGSPTIVGANAPNGQAPLDLTIGVSPYSPVAPVPIVPDPFAPAANPASAYVASLYRSVLGREGTADEVAGWVARIDGGMTWTQVDVASVNSVEHRTIEVDSYYEHFLGRAPDPMSQGLVNLMLNGMSEQQMTQAFLSSPEYQSEHVSDASFVQSLYLNVLGRQGEQAGIAGWEAALAGGMSRAQVVNLCVNSTEAVDQVVDSFYLSYLRRQPDPLSSGWTNLLASGFSASSAEEAFLAGKEYVDLCIAEGGG